MTRTVKVVIEERGHVLLIGLNRPEKYNAFDHDTWHEVARAYKLLESNKDLRCGLVYANGKHFTAGLDLPQWTDVFSSGEWPEIPTDECDPLGLRPEHRCRKPIVMAIHGICYTIGIELALGAEVRVCGRSARFGQIEVKRGIIACGGATVRMVQEFGYANAQRYLLTGDEFDAETALRIGMVQEVVDDEKVFEAGLALATNIAAQAPLAVEASLESSRSYLLNGLDECARLVAREVPLMKSEDAAEGVASFKERRQAVFKGR
ncbi:crotonase/enoyl-CoA hydratase family protein [Zhongshania borealis]|uniref:Crotonase/enoyl-CoA hydratase family protein n=1 Tax=Zhongshania borealis TaxID=889488 RepID=A0ABP7WE71_9GAMM